jgi:hypothetical protein
VKTDSPLALFSVVAISWPCLAAKPKSTHVPTLEYHRMSGVARQIWTRTKLVRRGRVLAFLRGFAPLLSSQRKLEVNAFSFLQRRENAGKIRGGGAALWPQHAHQALGRYLCALFELLESDRRVDVVAQDGLAGSEVAVDDALNGFA